MRPRNRASREAQDVGARSEPHRSRFGGVKPRQMRVVPHRILRGLSFGRMRSVVAESYAGCNSRLSNVVAVRSRSHAELFSLFHWKRSRCLRGQQPLEFNINQGVINMNGSVGKPPVTQSRLNRLWRWFKNKDNGTGLNNLNAIIAILVILGSASVAIANYVFPHESSCLDKMNCTSYQVAYLSTGFGELTLPCKEKGPDGWCLGSINVSDLDKAVYAVHDPQRENATVIAFCQLADVPSIMAGIVDHRLASDPAIKVSVRGNVVKKRGDTSRASRADQTMLCRLVGGLD